MEGEVLADVIRRAQHGDATAFDQLVDAFSSRIMGFLYRLTGSREDAEDLLQEVFLRVVRVIVRYEHDGRFEHWVLRIAANLARDRVRQAKRSPKRASAPRGDDEDRDGASQFLDAFEGSDAPADNSLIHRENMDALNAALAQLPDGEREVIVLRHFSQMSFKEIAEWTHTPLGTALARAHRGLLKLRELMTSEETGQANLQQRSTPMKG